mmetsp:Transcript_4715/g.10608  ORF Transcript_4715/g.10608 Transcript_4715/m.10608 type:complete len:245 (-) Transcript_4715:855-1589(-)
MDRLWRKIVHVEPRRSEAVQNRDRAVCPLGERRLLCAVRGCHMGLVGDCALREPYLVKAVLLQLVQVLPLEGCLLQRGAGSSRAVEELVEVDGYDSLDAVSGLDVEATVREGQRVVVVVFENLFVHPLHVVILHLRPVEIAVQQTEDGIVVVNHIPLDVGRIPLIEFERLVHTQHPLVQEARLQASPIVYEHLRAEVCIVAHPLAQHFSHNLNLVGVPSLIRDARTHCHVLRLQVLAAAAGAGR